MNILNILLAISISLLAAVAILAISSLIIDHLGCVVDENDYFLASLFLLIPLIIFFAIVIIKKISKNDELEKRIKENCVTIENIQQKKDSKYLQAPIYVNDKKININNLSYIEENGKAKLIINIGE